MKPLISRLSLILLSLLSTQIIFSQGRRLALVIGNSDDQNAGFLLNPGNDARDIGRALRNTGFQVTELQNVGLIDMKKAIDLFGEQLKGFDVGLFYYAGHGIQAKGVN